MKFTAFSKLDFFNNQLSMVKQKSQRTKRSAVSLMTELGSESNAHGLAKIAKTDKTSRKIMWGFLVVLGFAAATLQLSLLVQKYLDYQVVEVSRMRDGMPVEFPTVTVCNIAAISLTKTKQVIHSEKADILKWINFTSTFNFGQQKERLESIQGYYENCKEESMFLAHGIEHFILHCRYNEQDCTVDNFTTVFDGSNYYNCFTFNSGEHKDQVMVHATGPQYGLSLILSLDNDDPPPGAYGLYNMESNIANGAGVRVIIHAPNTMPFPVEHGFDVPPGYTTSVSLKASLHSRLSTPHGNCTTDMLQGSRLYRQNIFSCLQLCKQKIIVAKCGCQSSGLPHIHGHQNLTYCGTVPNWRHTLQNATSIQNKNISLPELDCEVELMRKLANDRTYEKSCECFQPCTELNYQKSISLSYWPLEFYQMNILELLLGETISQTFLNDAYTYLNNLTKADRTKYSNPDLDREKQLRASNLIRQNLVRLNVYLEDLSVIEFLQMPAYELKDLFADIGGTLGLWMGISVLTIMELVELIVRLILLLFNSERKLPDHEPVGNGMLENEREYERTYDTDPETPV